MMRQACAWVVTAAFVLALAVPAFAQGTSPAPAAPPPAAPAAPAVKAPAKTDAKMAMKPKSATGMLKSASAESVVIVAGKDKKEWMFLLGPDTKIMKGGKAAEAKDLAEKDPVTVQYTEADGKMMAKTVTVKAAKGAKKPQS